MLNSRPSSKQDGPSAPVDEPTRSLGWRLLGPLAGWIAAFLLAFDGYLIAFARFVQYQSMVLLTSALAVLILYRLLRQPQALARYLTLAAILLATGLLSHYDAAMTVVPLLFLLAALLWQRRVTWSSLLRAALPGSVAPFICSFN